MKLQNKKTGEIGNLVLNINPNRESYSVLSTENGDTICGNLVLADYDSLAELNEEWEDYEEPKSTIKDVWFNSTLANGHFVEIDFISDEEAEKAVEKLKAWKRLKDKGFRFLGYYHRLVETKSKGEIGFEVDDYKDTKQDLHLLFGGEE